MGAAYNNTKSSVHKACDHCKASKAYNIDYSDSNSYVGEAEHYCLQCNTVLIVMICLGGADHSVVIVIGSLIQR